MPSTDGDRVCVWQAKSRFGALRRAVDINMVNLPFVIYACFVLHNYCEASKDRVDDNRVIEAIQYARDNQPHNQLSEVTP